MKPEQLEAAYRYGEGRVVRRVGTRVDVTTVKAVRAKLRSVAARAEAGCESRDLLHDLWKAMDWLPDAFTPGFRALLEGRERGEGSR